MAGILFLNSCVENRTGKDATVPMQNDTRVGAEEISGEELGVSNGSLDDGAEGVNPEFSNDELAAVYEGYLEVKSALVDSNAGEASDAAESLAESLEEVEAEENALRAAGEIAENEELNAQRTAFSDLSASVGSMMKGALASGEIYEQYCPMAFEGAGGYWLSASEEVRNPYYGDKMLKCGRVSDTIQ